MMHCYPKGPLRTTTGINDKNHRDRFNEPQYEPSPTVGLPGADHPYPSTFQHSHHTHTRGPSQGAHHPSSVLCSAHAPNLRRGSSQGAHHPNASLRLLPRSYASRPASPPHPSYAATFRALRFHVPQLSAAETDPSMHCSRSWARTGRRDTRRRTSSVGCVS